MADDEKQGVRATGGCLCGALRYEVRGPLRDVRICHCQFCQRMNTYAAAYTACAPADLRIINARTLRWHRFSPAVRRGFCSKCGSALFWERTPPAHISISAGSLDRPTGLKLEAHLFLEQRADYDEAPGAA